MGAILIFFGVILISVLLMYFDTEEKMNLEYKSTEEWENLQIGKKANVPRTTSHIINPDEDKKPVIKGPDLMVNRGRTLYPE